MEVKKNYRNKMLCLPVLQNQALELSWVHGNPVFLSWTQNRTSSCLDSHQVALCRQLGEKLGLKDGEQVGFYTEQFILLHFPFEYSLHYTT